MAGEERQSFGALLRQHRVAARLTQEELAERAGLSGRGIQDLERGARRAPYPDTVQRLGAALDLSADARARLLAVARQARTRTDLGHTSHMRTPALPRPLTSFVGRERELDAVVRLLRTKRLLTLVGTAGVGKTRLAMEAVRHLGSELEEEFMLVELAPLDAPALVAQAVAAAVGVPEQAGRSLIDGLVNALGGRPMLLGLDNCEHLVDASARLVDALLRACPEVRILATSREPLGVPGEVVWQVAPLPLPTREELEVLASSDAVRLFVVRAEAVQPRFALTAANAGAVAQVCRRLDGLPLAIELAAARVAALAPRDMADRLDHALGLLVGGDRIAAPRQRTLEAAIAWSYDLLAVDERPLFERLAVFAGGFSLDGAEAIAADGAATPDALARLVSKSLVQAEPQVDGSMRYRLLEPLRQFAHERLGERCALDDARDRHAAYVVALAERAASEMAGPEQLAWIRRLDAEWDNIRAAHTWAREQGDGDRALRLAAALGDLFARPDRRVEGRTRLEEALAVPGAAESRTILRARVLTALATLAVSQSDLPTAGAALDEALAIAREHADPATEARTAGVMASLRLFQADADGARDHAERSLTLARRARDRWVELEALRTLADLALAAGDPNEASAACESGLRIARAAGDPYNQAMLLNASGDVARWRGDYARAGAAYEEALALFHSMAAPATTFQGLRHNLGYVALGQGDPGRSAELFLESAELYGMTGRDQRGVAECVMGLGCTALQAGRPTLAACLFGAAEAELEALGTTFTPANRGDYERSLAALRAALEPERLAADWAKGRGMSLEDALAQAAVLQG
jgi:predicted ATPase/DNA-binding XRE family transcriptional regulator